MKKLIVIAAFAAASFIASAAIAADCTNSEKKHVSLDWARGTFKQPLIGLALRVVAESCDAAAKDKNTGYYFEPLFGNKEFVSKEDVERRIAMVKAEQFTRKTMNFEEMNKALAGLDKAEQEKVEKEKTANKN